MPKEVVMAAPVACPTESTWIDGPTRADPRSESRVVGLPGSVEVQDR